MDELWHTYIDGKINGKGEEKARDKWKEKYVDSDNGKEEEEEEEEIPLTRGTLKILMERMILVIRLSSQPQGKKVYPIITLYCCKNITLKEKNETRVRIFRSNKIDKTKKIVVFPKQHCTGYK